MLFVPVRDMTFVASETNVFRALTFNLHGRAERLDDYPITTTGLSGYRPGIRKHHKKVDVLNLLSKALNRRKDVEVHLP